MILRSAKLHNQLTYSKYYSAHTVYIVLYDIITYNTMPIVLTLRSYMLIHQLSSTILDLL